MRFPKLVSVRDELRVDSMTAARTLHHNTHHYLYNYNGASSIGVPIMSSPDNKRPRIGKNDDATEEESLSIFTETDDEELMELANDGDYISECEAMESFMEEADVVAGRIEEDCIKHQVKECLDDMLEKMVPVLEAEWREHARRSLYKHFDKRFRVQGSKVDALWGIQNYADRKGRPRAVRSHQEAWGAKKICLWTMAQVQGKQRHMGEN